MYTVIHWRLCYNCVYSLPSIPPCLPPQLVRAVPMRWVCSELLLRSVLVLTVCHVGLVQSVVSTSVCGGLVPFPCAVFLVSLLDPSLPHSSSKRAHKERL